APVGAASAATRCLIRAASAGTGGAKARGKLCNRAIRCQRLKFVGPGSAKFVELVQRMVQLRIEPTAAIAPMLLVQRGQADLGREERAVVEDEADGGAILGEGATTQQHLGVGFVVARVAVE